MPLSPEAGHLQQLTDSYHHIYRFFKLAEDTFRVQSENQGRLLPTGAGVERAGVSQGKLHRAEETGTRSCGMTRLSRTRSQGRPLRKRRSMNSREQ